MQSHRELAALLIIVLITCGAYCPVLSAAEDLPQTLWLEAETFGPLKGSNFSYQPVAQTTKGSWAVSGPGVAAEWTQGGESEWMSVAARADEPGEIVIGRDAEAPAAGNYTLWVRYADYRGKKQSFGVRVRQGEKVNSHIFGEKPVIDDLDPMKLLWDWAFGWDHCSVELQKGPVHVELYTTGPTEARRQIDCICLTTDQTYHPSGREKPDSATWRVLRDMQKARQSGSQNPPAELPAGGDIPKAWTIASGPPTFLWNTGDPWLSELKRPGDHFEWPFTSDAPILKDFLTAYTGKAVPVFDSPLSGAAWHIPLYPTVMADDSPFLKWMDAHPDRKFCILLNYGEPSWPKDANRAAVFANLQKRSDRFVGYIAGEGISYDAPDQPALDAKIKAAVTRGEILAAIRDAHTVATVKKYSDYAGTPLTPQQAWGPDIPCLSAGMEAFAHALVNWGVKRLGHENTGNSPTLARRLAFMRGAARQFGAKIVDYQSCNLGDASTIFSRESFFYPGNSKYILDNQYDAWAGSGTNWVLKDYLLFHLAGADAFYHEEGVDIYWKPGGNSAGDGFPVQLSPRGRVTEAVIRLAHDHPRGTQYTPVAFLLDEAHGYSQEFFSPGVFGLDPQLNPKLLSPGPHFDSIRGWFDIAYFPAPQTQNEPATAIRQTYVNGIFGDIFDVIVVAPQKTQIAATYPLLIAAGEINLSEEWGKILEDDIERGSTLVVCANQLSGPGVASLALPQVGPESEASNFDWVDGKAVDSNVFRVQSPSAKGGQVLAVTHDGQPIVVSYQRGKGKLIYVAVPMGLGIDRRPVPMLALLMERLSDPLMPIRVAGDVEWTLNSLNGGWVIALINNRGINKPQHGVNPTDLREEQTVTLSVPTVVAASTEWITASPLAWRKMLDQRSLLTVTVPAGGVRLVEFH